MKNLAFFTLGLFTGSISVVTLVGGFAAGVILEYEINKKEIVKKSKQMSYTSYMN